MAKLDKAEDVLKKLGLDPKNLATIKYGMWQPWMSNEEHSEDPQGFTGMFGGYKLASKEVEGDIRAFDLFAFDDCSPAPKDGSSGWLVASSYMLEDLKRVKPGTKIAIVYTGSEANDKGGQTHKLMWVFANPKDKATATLPKPQLPTNLEIKALPPANGVNSGTDKDIPF